MLSGNDHVGSFLNSVQFVKSGIKKVAKDFDNGARNLQLVMGKMNDRKEVIPININLGSNGHEVDIQEKGSRKKDHVKDEGNNINFLHWCSNAYEKRVSCEITQRELKGQSVMFFHDMGRKDREGNSLPLECFTGFVCDQFTKNLLKFDMGVQESEFKNNLSPFDHLKVVIRIFEGKRADFIALLGNFKFAKIGGVPSTLVGVTSPIKEDSGGNGIPLSRGLAKDHPDRKKLFSVEEFFKYSESEGMRFFNELDRDGDGLVTLEDLEVALRQRKLPHIYAHEFMRRTRSHLFSKSIGWKHFLSLMEQKEPTILRAYNTLCLRESGTLEKSDILASLKNVGFPTNEDNAVAIMRFLSADKEESIGYGHFRNFMILLPSDRLQKDSRNIWFEAATGAVAPPVEVPVGNVLKSALAGGLSCAFSTILMHPIDTIKTQVQASTLSLPEIISKIPQIGLRGLYRGATPSILGQFMGHGLRTGIFEGSKIMLINVAPALAGTQVQSVLAFCSTILGTVTRVPSEVLKQRLQAGVYDGLGEAIIGTWNQDGPKAFFRGTGATLCREVPFYVAGLGFYTESKKVIRKILRRDLDPWETIAVGAVTGGLTAVLTTPFDVIKTRMMIATQGQPMSMSIIALSILRHEGPLGLFKGAVPRFFWVAPLGAINFAGYELTRKALGVME